MAHPVSGAGGPKNPYRLSRCNVSKKTGGRRKFKSGGSRDCEAERKLAARK